MNFKLLYEKTTAFQKAVWFSYRFTERLYEFRTGLAGSGCTMNEQYRPAPTARPAAGQPSFKAVYEWPALP